LTTPPYGECCSCLAALAKKRDPEETQNREISAWQSSPKKRHDGKSMKVPQIGKSDAKMMFHNCSMQMSKEELPK
jgi:hypothetical protein